MMVLEQQRIPTKKKNKEWRKGQMNRICSRVDEFGNDWYRIHQNHRMKNNQINQDEYREYCDTLGLKRGEAFKFVEPFNKSHNIIEVMKGEEAKMPWSFGVINLSPKATNDMLREQQRDYVEWMDSRLQREIEMVEHKNELILAMQMEQIRPDQMDREMDKKREELKERDRHILNPEQIRAKYSNFKSKKEKAIHKLLKAIAVNDNLKWLKNETFEDALVAGVEAVEICVNEFTKRPYIRQINALNLFYHKSADTPFIQDSDYAGYKEEMTVSDVLDRYGEDMNEEDLRKLKGNTAGVYGANAKFHSKDGWSPSKWEEISKYEYGYHHPLSTFPHGTGSSNVLSDGLYASDKSKYYGQSTAVVYTTYWKSQRKVGKLTYINKYGKPEVKIVGEDYPVPERAKKVNYRPHVFSKARTKYEWDADFEGITGKRSLEWIWIPEVWKGTRINGDIYVKIEPYEHAYQSLLDPYKTKLPIHGFIYGNRNAFSTCVMDRVKPWQKLYYIVMSKWLKLITQDKGVVQLLNVLMMDKKIGHKKAMAIAVDQGYLPFNPLAHSQGAGQAHSHKPAERLDLSNSQQLTHYTNILEFIERQMKVSAGVPDARMAQTGKSTNVTDNQRDVSQSLNITNSIFAGHELLWQEVLQSLCETAVKTMDSQNGFIRQILSDDEIALIDLDLISLEDEYAVKVGNNTRAHNTLQEAKGFIQALIQNDKINFSTLISMLETDNLNDFKDELAAIEKDIETREAQLQEQKQQHEAEQARKEQQDKADERAHELEKIRLEGEYDLIGKQIGAMAWDPEKDRDGDGLPDLLEIHKFRNEAFNQQEQRNIDRLKLHQEDRKLQQQENEAAMRDRQESANRQQNATLKDKEIKSKERIEKAKAKAKPAPTKK